MTDMLVSTSDGKVSKVVDSTTLIRPNFKSWKYEQINNAHISSRHFRTLYDLIGWSTDKVGLTWHYHLSLF